MRKGRVFNVLKNFVFDLVIDEISDFESELLH